MPFAPNKLNFHNVLSTHLREGEQIIGMVAVPRVIVGLTNQRLLHSNFPFFLEPKLKFESAIGDITSIDSRPQGQNLIVSISTGSGQHEVKIQSVLGDAPGQLTDLLEKMKAQNPSLGGASYFGEGEEEIQSVQVKQGSLRITNQHIFLVGKKPGPDGAPDIQRKLALADVRAFDIYQGNMGATYLVIQGDDKLETYKMGASALGGGSGVLGSGAGDFASTDWWPIRMMRALSEANPAGSRPTYLEADERIICSMRMGKSKAGVITAKYVLRLTDRRLLWLVIGDGGALKVEKAIDRAQVRGGKVTKHLANGVLTSLEINWELEGGKETTFVPGDFEEATKLLRGELSV